MTREHVSASTFWGPWRLVGWGSAAVLLILPAVAMQFTSEVNWSIGDFIIAAMMFSVVGLGIELAVRSSAHPSYRSAAAVALLTGLLVFWANGAVGIIGNEDHPANLLFFAVLALAVVGSFLARFRARGMVIAIGGAALAQFAAPFIAMAIWAPPFDAGMVRTILFNSVFAAMWLFSASLFRRASHA